MRWSHYIDNLATPRNFHALPKMSILGHVTYARTWRPAADASREQNNCCGGAITIAHDANLMDCGQSATASVAEWRKMLAIWKKPPFRFRPLCGRLSVGKGISALRLLVVAPMCPAFQRGFAWPRALMPFARVRSLPIARTRSAGVGRVFLLRRFQPACCVSSVCPLQLV